MTQASANDEGVEPPLTAEIPATIAIASSTPGAATGASASAAGSSYSTLPFSLRAAFGRTNAASSSVALPAPVLDGESGVAFFQPIPLALFNWRLLETMQGRQLQQHLFHLLLALLLVVSCQARSLLPCPSASVQR